MHTSELYENEVSLGSEQSRTSEPNEPLASQELPAGFFAALEQSQTGSDKQTSEVSDHTDDEELVQSQLAREENEASVEKEAAALLNDIASAQLEAELVAQFEEPAEQAPHEQEAPQQQQTAEPAQDGASKFDRLRVLLQDGLGLLRSADLTREETNQLEDMFMDMKQELYQAERRGRK